MQLVRAKKLAEAIREHLAPMCDKIVVAGSIRRARPHVGDIDLVILPKPGLKDAIKVRCLVKGIPVTDGEQNAIYRLRLSDQTEVQLDIFFARPASADLLDTTPGNFGSLLLCRTGSKEHNIFMVEHAKRMGLVWNPYRGVFDGAGKCLASESEEEIFKALDLPFIEPERRER
jgi:DNA polymerase (family 10)